MRRWVTFILVVLLWIGSVLVVFYKELDSVRVAEEKVYVLRKCRCKDYLKFRRQYRIGVLVDEKGKLCSLKCKF